MNAKKPSPQQMKSTVWTMLELDLIHTDEMRELAQWMLEEYRTNLAKNLVAKWNREKKAAGDDFRYPASVVKGLRNKLDISFDNDGIIDAHARSVGLELVGEDGR